MSVLAEAGLDQAEIGRLLDAGVVAVGDSATDAQVDEGSQQYIKGQG